MKYSLSLNEQKMNYYNQNIINFDKIKKERYTSHNPKIMYIVSHDILNFISIKKFGFIKKEQSRIFGWVWETNRIKIYQSFCIENEFTDIISYKLQFFDTKKAAEEHALWLVFNGGKIKNVD